MHFKKRKIYKVKSEEFDEREFKFLDTNKDGTVGDILSTWNIYQPSLCLLTRGNGTNNRIGDTVYIKELELRMTLEMPNQTGVTANAQCGDLVRVLIYQDAQVNGAGPVYSDIVTVNNYKTMYNPYNVDRFKVLYDEIHECHQSGASQGGTPVSVWGHRFKDLGHLCIPIENKVHYNANTGAISDIISGNIGIMVCAAFSGNISLDVNARIWFTD